MNLISPLVPKSIENVDLGELLIFSHTGGSVIGVKLFQQDGFGRAIIGVLRGDGEHRHPHLLEVGGHFSCASYGSEWEFEILTAGEVTDDASDYETPGMVVLGHQGAGLRLGRNPFDIRSSGGYWLIGKWEMAHSMHAPNLGVRRWRVWHNSEERRRSGGVPLIEFPGE